MPSPAQSEQQRSGESADSPTSAARQGSALSKSTSRELTQMGQAQGSPKPGRAKGMAEAAGSPSPKLGRNKEPVAAPESPLLAVAAPPPSDFLFPMDWIATPPNDDGFVIRPLRIDDYEKGYGELLHQLTTTLPLTRDRFEGRFRRLQRLDATNLIVVIEEKATGKLVASGTLVIELKFVHSCGQVGHIEDIVCDETYRGKQLGRRIIDQLKHLGERSGCYKVILDCAEKNVGFYEKLGFLRKEIQMALYFGKS